MTLREKLGQRLVTGFPGTEMSEEFKQAVREYKVANVILFKRNITSCAQLKRLCGDIDAFVRQETGHGAFITIDQEGGIVSRLPEDGVNVPGAMAIAATGKVQNAYKAGLITAKELRSLGVNFDLAPCVDVNSNAANPVIGVRSYGDTPNEVSEYAVQMIRGLQDGGVLCAAKHFPGHGDTSTDSHLTLPCVDKAYDQLLEMELKPFIAAIAADVPAVMTTHILFPQLEPSGVPATMSRTIMTGILREKLGFNGLIISDCMEMNAIKEYYGTVNGVVAAMGAGVDLVFISHSTELCGQAILMAEKAVADGTLSAKEIAESAERIIAFKGKWLDNAKIEESFNFATANMQAEEMLAETITEVQIPDAGRVAVGGAPICIGCPLYRTALIGNEVNENDNFFGKIMVSELGGSAKCMSENPGEEEIADIVKCAQGHSCAVVGTYNSHLRPGQRSVVEGLAHAGIPVIAIAMRNPYDLASLPKEVYSLAVFEYTERSIRAVARVLRGEKTAHGKLPINKLTAE